MEADYRVLLGAGIAAAALLYLLSKPIRKANVVEVGDAKPGATIPRRSAHSKVALATQLYDDVSTLYENFQRTVRLHGDRPALGTRVVSKDGAGPYEWKTYSEVGALVTDAASGFVELGLKPGSSLGLYSKNREEWLVTAEGASCVGVATVALYDTLGQDNLVYVLNHSQIPVVVASAECVPALLEQLPHCKFLKTIVQMEPLSPLTKQQAAAAGLPNIMSFQDLLLLGRNNPHKHSPPKPDDTAVIMYTSGTTGVPKGVVLTHRSVIAAMAGIILHLQDNNVQLTSTDRYISYLPLAHILERVAESALLAKGAAIGFYQGDPRALVSDIQELKPTLMAGVPKVFERIRDGVHAKLAHAGVVARTLFRVAFLLKTFWAARGYGTPVLDKVVFAKFRANVGGNMRFMLSGGAPMSGELHNFMKLCFCCPVLQGYGLTETSAAGLITTPQDLTFAHVGIPVRSVEIKLVDVPDLNYLSTDTPCPRGEVCIRGPSNSSGYYKDPTKTKEDFKEDGWFHTGDIGRWNKDGTLSIIDRKKNIFKLAQGEYIAAEKLELAFLESSYVGQIWIYGDSTQSVLVAVVVPKPLAVKNWAAQNGLQDDAKVVCEDVKFSKAVLDDIVAAGKRAKLAGFEFPKAIHLEPEEWTPATDMVSPTLKLKRPQLQKRYQEHINRMYKSIPTTSTQR